MQKRQLNLVASAAFTGLVALTAFAATAQAAESPLYFRAMAGLMNPSAAGLDDSFNIGAGLGFEVFDQPNGSAAVEADITTTLKKGRKSSGGDWNTDTVAVYFAYRTAGDVFFKAKAGFADQTIRGTSQVSEGSNLSGGIGVGWRATRKAGVELEYTAFDHLNFLSMGIYSHF